MFLSSALVAGALAFQATAFLIPPEISSATDLAKGQPPALWSIRSQIYEVDCPGCPFSGLEDDYTPWEEEVENRIHLEFRVDDNQRLRINDVPVFPLDLSLPLQLDITASQVRAADLQRSPPLPLGFALEIFPQTLSDEEPEKRLIRARFTILDLNGTIVDVETVKIDLLELVSQSGTFLSIVKISSTPFDEMPDTITCAGTSKLSLCRLRAIIMTRLEEMLEAAKARAEAAHAWMMKPGCHGSKGGKLGHKQESKHHKEGHKHYKEGHKKHKGHRALRLLLHRIGHMLHQAIRFFIVPALLGIIGGLMASAVGMLVGQIVAYLWFRFHRNGERGKANLVEAVAKEEKETFLVDRELPPDYEDVEASTMDPEKK